MIPRTLPDLHRELRGGGEGIGSECGGLPPPRPPRSGVVVSRCRRAVSPPLRAGVQELQAGDLRAGGPRPRAPPQQRHPPRHLHLVPAPAFPFPTVAPGLSETFSPGRLPLRQGGGATRSEKCLRSFFEPDFFRLPRPWVDGCRPGILVSFKKLRRRRGVTPRRSPTRKRKGVSIFRLLRLRAGVRPSPLPRPGGGAGVWPPPPPSRSKEPAGVGASSPRGGGGRGQGPPPRISSPPQTRSVGCATGAGPIPNPATSRRSPPHPNPDRNPSPQPHQSLRGVTAELGQGRRDSRAPFPPPAASRSTT